MFKSEIDAQEWNWCSRVNIDVQEWILMLKSEYWCSRVNIDAQEWILMLKSDYWCSRVNIDAQEWILPFMTLPRFRSFQAKFDVLKTLYHERQSKEVFLRNDARDVVINSEKDRQVLLTEIERKNLALDQLTSKNTGTFVSIDNIFVAINFLMCRYWL